MECSAPIADAGDMRRSGWLALVLCSAWLGCDEPSPDTTPAPKDAAPEAAQEAAPEPTLDAGVELIEDLPLEPLVRLGSSKTPPAPLPAFVPGTTREFVFSVKLTEGRKKVLHVPEVRVVADLEVLTRTQDAAQIRWTPRELQIPNTEGADEAFLTTFRGALTPSDPPTAYTLQTDAYNTLEALPWPASQDTNASTVASALELSLGHLAVATPPEGLSKGASWTTQRSVDLFGMPTWQRIESTATKLDGNQLEVKGSVVFTAPVADAEVLPTPVTAFGAQVTSIWGEGKLRARYDLAAGAPVDMQLQGTLSMAVTDGTTKRIGFEVRADENYLAHPDARVALRGEVTNGGLVVGKAPAGTKVWFNKKKLPVSDEGDFVFGFGRNAPPRALLAFSFEDGPPIRHILHVADRRFEPEAIDGLPEAYVNYDKETKRALAKSKTRIAKVRGKVSKVPRYRDGFVWPAKGKLTSTYGRKRILNGQEKGFHWGVDIAGRKGKPIKAPAGGVVVFAEEDVPLSGNLLIIDHGHGLTSSFLHLQKIKVKVGDEVKRGQTIATLGNTGRSTGPHLDWRMNWLDTRVDPQLLVPPR